MQTMHNDTTLKHNLEEHHSDVEIDPVLTTITLQGHKDFELEVQPVKLENSKILNNLGAKLQHLSSIESEQLASSIKGFKDLFSDVPNRAEGAYHDVDVEKTRPIKQHPYKVGPAKAAQMDKEVQYMYQNGFIEPSNSPWCSPCHLVPKPDGSNRFVTDFRKVNDVTRKDSYPLPRVDLLIDEVGNAKYVTKLDLMKGYWQIPLTERAKDISAFSTGSPNSGLWRYLVCPFGMCNSGQTFQRFMDTVIRGLHNTAVYVDDIIVYNESWEEHVRDVVKLFERLRCHKLTVNLAKSEFAKAQVQYLGFVVGQGRILPSTAKVQAILQLSPPTNRKGVQRIIGLIGYYRKFCPNLSTIMAPLTDLNSPKAKFVWTKDCQVALDKVKRVLTNTPVLTPPQYDREFRLYVDSSDTGIGASLMQEGNDGIEHPVSYYSKKLDKHQRNYSTVEKEALSLLMAVKFYDVYITSSSFPVRVYTDHNPLVFVNRMRIHNQRLLRWSLTLQEYNLNICHVKGTDNVIADTLSRG